MLNNSISSVCIFCKDENESVSGLWSEIMRCWGVQWVIPGTVNGLLHWWTGFNKKKNLNECAQNIGMNVYFKVYNQT